MKDTLVLAPRRIFRIFYGISITARIGRWSLVRPSSGKSPERRIMSDSAFHLHVSPAGKNDLNATAL
jgi:hypothetical protein